jgi:transposase
MCTHLADLESDRQRQRNRLHALQHAACPSSTVLENLHQQIDFLTHQIDHVQQAIQDHIDHHPDLKQQRDLLDSIQGIGPLTAAKLLGEYGDMRQFTDVRQVVAFAGLNPRHHQSGTSVKGHTSISKMGRSSIRAALYMPAVVAKRANPRLAAFADRLASRGLCQMQIIVAVMRKLLHFAFGVLKSGQLLIPISLPLPLLDFQDGISDPLWIAFLHSVFLLWTRSQHGFDLCGRRVSSNAQTILPKTMYGKNYMSVSQGCIGFA